MIMKYLICINIIQRGVINVNSMNMARCIIELERIYVMQNGGIENYKYICKICNIIYR